MIYIYIMNTSLHTKIKFDAFLPCPQGLRSRTGWGFRIQSLSLAGCGKAKPLKWIETSCHIMSFSISCHEKSTFLMRWVSTLPKANFCAKGGETVESNSKSISTVALGSLIQEHVWWLLSPPWVASAQICLWLVSSLNPLRNISQTGSPLQVWMKNYSWRQS